MSSPGSEFFNLKNQQREEQGGLLLGGTVTKQPGRERDVSGVQRCRPSSKRQQHCNMSSASLSFGSGERATATPATWGTSAGRSHSKNNLAMAWEKQLCSKWQTTSRGRLESQKLGET